ncbi:hypothetical protein N9S81_00240, partial [bacterium]|nr:hypothetical protein [bacterium]
MNINVDSLRVVDAPCFDPYNVLSTSCAFLESVFAYCSAHTSNPDFQSTAGRFCITSILTLSLKFCKGDSFATIVDEHGGLASMAVIIYRLLFGKFEVVYGKRHLVSILLETELHLLNRLGGNLFAVFHTSIAARAEAAIEEALSLATDKTQRNVVLKCRNVAVVYSITMHCVSGSSEVALCTAVRSGKHSADLLARASLLVATNSLFLAGAALPHSLQTFLESQNPSVMMMAIRLLNFCRVNKNFIPLITSARRDVWCGKFLDENIQLNLLHKLIIRARALSNAEA